MVKKRRPTDSTLRNVRAANDKIERLARRVRVLERIVTRLQHRMKAVE